MTVKRPTISQKSEMREVGKVYNGMGDVYIKIREELLSAYGDQTTFMIAFHYVEISFTLDLFLYRKQ